MDIVGNQDQGSDSTPPKAIGEPLEDEDPSDRLLGVETQLAWLRESASMTPAVTEVPLAICQSAARPIEDE